MTNYIGERIKGLRRKADVTQEKLADYLGITFQAVSRWESGISYPDLEILPAIANYFNVTTDELLGVDIVNKQARIDEIRVKLRVNFTKGFVKDNIGILRNAVNEFPNDFGLLSDLAFYLGKYSETRNEAISINERILSDCADDQIRYGVMQKLAYDYNAIGEKEKAIQTAMKLPYTPLTSDMLLRHIYDGDEKVNQYQRNIQSFCDYITDDIEGLASQRYNNFIDQDGIKKRIELYKKAAAIYGIIYDEGDLGFYNTRMYHICSDTARCYMRLNEYDSALDSIEKAAEYVIAFDTMPEVFTHTSIIPNGQTFTKAENFAKDYEYNDSYEMLHKELSNGVYDPIRDTERYKAVVARLEQVAAVEK